MSAAAPLAAAHSGPVRAAAVASMVVAGALGIARCGADARVPAAAAFVAALALLWPALRHNRGTLPAALVAGALPTVLSLRDHPFPAYHAMATGVLLVACAECTVRAWYVQSNAPRQRDGRWTSRLVVLLGAGALAAAGVVLAGRARLDGAVVLTFVGASALVLAGVVAVRVGNDPTDA